MTDHQDEAMRNKPKHCAGTKRDGTPCQARMFGATGYCFVHDTDRAEQRRQVHQKAGHNRANLVRLRGLVPPRLISIFDRLEEAMTEVHNGSLEPQRGQAIASLARAMVSVLTAGELEERVRQIEGRAIA